eukprot:s5655_g2.t1
MPGPWIEFANNPDFYRDFSLEKGTFVETTLAHAVCQERGHGLWQVSQEGQKEKDGIWAMARLIAVSDDSLASWLNTGSGASFNRHFRLHLCSMPMAGCRHRDTKHLDEFHSDCFRVVDSVDFKEDTIPWCVSAVSKEDLRSELAMLASGAPGDYSHRGVVDPRVEVPARNPVPGGAGPARGLGLTQSGGEVVQGANDEPFEVMDSKSESTLKKTAPERDVGGDFAAGESHRSRSPPLLRAGYRPNPSRSVKHDTTKGPVDSFSMRGRKGELVGTPVSASGAIDKSAGRDWFRTGTPTRRSALGSEPLAERGRDDVSNKRARSSGSARPPSPFTSLPPDPSAEENSEASDRSKPKEEGLGGKQEHQRPRPGSEWCNEAPSQAPRRITAEIAPKEGGAPAAAAKHLSRPKSPLVRKRALKHPPEGEIGQRSIDVPLVPKDLAENPEGCPVNLLNLNLRIADDLQD